MLCCQMSLLPALTQPRVQQAVRRLPHPLVAAGLPTQKLTAEAPALELQASELVAETGLWAAAMLAQKLPPGRCRLYRRFYPVAALALQDQRHPAPRPSLAAHSPAWWVAARQSPLHRRQQAQAEASAPVRLLRELTRWALRPAAPLPTHYRHPASSSDGACRPLKSG